MLRLAAQRFKVSAAVIPSLRTGKAGAQVLLATAALEDTQVLRPSTAAVALGANLANTATAVPKHPNLQRVAAVVAD